MTEEERKTTSVWVNGQHYQNVTNYKIEAQIELHNYNFFYDLSKEMLELCQKASQTSQKKDNMDAINRYSIACVIFSFTIIENFIAHILYSTTFRVHEIINSFSKELQDRFKFMSLQEKVELALLLYKSKDFKGNFGKEPYQSFDLLRRLRNHVIHHVPSQELLFSITFPEEETKEEVLKLEKSLADKFTLNHADDTKFGTFVERCFSASCAEWAFKQVEPFLNWICDEFEIEKPKFN